MSAKLWKVLGVVLTIGGAALSLGSSFVSAKNQENQINEAAANAVTKALAEKTNS